MSGTALDRAPSALPGVRYGAVARHGDSRGAFRELWRSPEVRRVVLMAGILIAAMDNFHYLIQPYLIDRGVQVGVAFSMLQVPIFVAGFGGALLAEPVRRRLGTNRILIVVPLAGGACYAALAATPGLAAYATFPLVAAVGSTIAPILSGYVNRRIDSERRATVLSIQGMVTSLTSAALVPSLGFATDNRGLPLAFLLGAATILVPLAVFGPGLLRRLDEGSFATTDADAAPISPA